MFLFCVAGFSFSDALSTFSFCVAVFSFSDALSLFGSFAVVWVFCDVLSTLAALAFDVGRTGGDGASCGCDGGAKRTLTGSR
jgi:hypothetical protein